MYTPQVDGTLTTWLARRADLEAVWGGSRPFGEVLDAARQVRLLRKDNLWIEGETAQDYVRLGHDALAKVAAAWKAEQEEKSRLAKAEQEEKSRLAEERARRRKLILRSVAGSIAAIVAIGAVSCVGYYVYFLNLINSSYIKEEHAMEQPDLDKSAKLLKEVWDVRKRWLGEDHPDTLLAAKELSDTYFSQNKFDKSEPLDHAVLDARLKALGEDHDDTLTSMIDLTNSYCYQRKYGLALPWYRRMVGVCLKRYNNNPVELKLIQLVRATNDLASVLQLSGSPKDAVRLLKDALARLQQDAGNQMAPEKRNLLIAYTEVNFGWVLLHQHSLSEAKEHIRHSQTSLARSQSSGWPHFAAKGLLAGIAQERKNGDGSDKELLDSYKGILTNTLYNSMSIPPLEMACLDDIASWLYEFYTRSHLPEEASKYRSPVKHRFPFD